MTRRAYLLGIAGVVAPRTMSAAASARVSVADLDVRPDGSDCGPGVVAAIGRLSKHSPSVLFFPAGVYTFAQTRGVAMRFDGFTNLVVEGPDATLMFAGLTRPFLFTNCVDPAIRGLTIDYIRPNFSQGEAIAISQDRRTIDLRVDLRFPIDGSERVRSLATYDPATGLMVSGGIDLSSGIDGVWVIGPQLLRLHVSAPLDLDVGSTVLLRHERGPHAVTFAECSNAVVEKLCIYTAPGMAVVAERCNGLRVQSLTVTPTPNSGRMMSTSADAIHLADCSGDLEIRGSLLRGMGDDCINVNTSYLKLVKRVDARTGVFTRWAKRPFAAAEVASRGSKLEFDSAATLEPIASAIVASAEAGETETVHFATNMPTALANGDLVTDVSLAPRLLVENCDFPGNRARGILVHRDAVIRNCRFSDQSEQAILLAPNTFWLEGPSVRDVLLENNEIRRPKPIEEDLRCDRNHRYSIA